MKELDIIKENFPEEIGLNAINATLLKYEFTYDAIYVHFKQKESNYRLEISFNEENIKIKIYIQTGNKNLISVFGYFCLFSAVIDTSDDWLKDVKKHVVHLFTKDKIVVEVEKGIATCTDPRVKIIDYDNDKNN